MSSRRRSFLSTNLHCSSCLPCPLYFEKFKPSEKLQEHGTERLDACHLDSPLRLKAAVHYTVGCLCEEVALDKEMQFSKQTIAAISELTFRQCENFAKDLEMFARHAKRTTINTEDVKLLARRSNSLLKYITDKSEEIAQINVERKAQKKKKSEDGSKNSREPAEAGLGESEN
ncbi:centromere protein S isoform X2 [Chlorocebus sabaeus]|uniref:centromere protein S isoform X2 n=1 Tax=Chlorocebus sabaeus TaxID=60711 RepID=UPI0018B09479|nr:centromere protein S isoform X2 [Chlorocebus sabaeus]XP_037840978.1 centromere protein S isoform X2 [Chlorocebus sabaeus]